MIKWIAAAFIISVVFTKGLILDQPEQCLFGHDFDVLWKQCECVPVGAEHSIHIMCRQVASATVPTIPNSEIRTSNDYTNIVALSMTEGGLAFLQQDAFKSQNIQTLDFSNNHIQTVNVNAFRGLEMKLTLLNLNHNNLSVVPAWALTYLHQLQFLKLEHNRITHIRSNTFDETQLNSLQFLHLDHNQIQLIPNLAFHRLRLIVLTLSNNRIYELEKMSLPATLSILDLRNNRLTHIPYLALNDLTNLHSLNMEGNNITLLDFHAEVLFKNEINLIVRNNKIKRLDENSLRSFRKLKELDLSYNQISLIKQSTFETVSSVKYLDLSYNKLAYLSHGTFKNFAKNMERLNLEENIIHTLPDALRDLHNLTYLNLNGNKLNSLDDEILEGFKKTITELFLAYNHLREVPTKVLTGMLRLQHLDLSKNKISSIEALAFGTFDGTGTSLTILNLAGNHIKNITDPGIFLYMTTLAYLDISYNQIEYIGPKSFEKLPALEKLFLQNNRLSSFSVAALHKLYKLRHLVLDNNRIKHLPAYLLGDLQRVEHLSIAGNLIHDIDDKVFHASSATELKSLNLAKNKIESISSRAFSNLENLQHLKLDHNQLRSLPSSAFTELRNLRFLDLSHNALLRLGPHTFHNLPAIEIIQLQNNVIEKIEPDAFYKIPKVDSFNLCHNRLVEFDCEYLGSIRTIGSLDLSSNAIQRIELSCIKRTLQRLNLAKNDLQSIGKDMMQDYDQLKELSLAYNNILEVQNNAFMSCPHLSVIDLSNNHIRTIWRGTFDRQELISQLDLSNNALISVQRGSLGKNNVLNLNLANNRLNRIPIDALETSADSLSSLSMEGNDISIIDAPHLVGLRNLTTVNLARNNVESVEDAAFEHLTNLRSMDISYNPITTWSPAAFRDLSHSILHINLANTGLFSIPKFSHRGLRHLNVSHNKIYELTERDLAPLRKIATLDISYNTLKTLDSDLFENLNDLRTLNISGNPIIHIDAIHFAHLYQLESLCISDMSALVHLPDAYAWAQFTNLKHLELFQLPDAVNPYNVSDIMKHLPPLLSLIIELKSEVLDNQLHSADKRLMRQLTITGKNLTHVDVGAFYALRGYRVHLTIRDTKLEEFPSAIFNTFSSVNYMQLSLPNNRLHYVNPFKNSIIPVVNQHGTILQSIDISGNPIECSCGMSWVADWLMMAPQDQDHHDFSNVYCHHQDKNDPLSVHYRPETYGRQCGVADTGSSHVFMFSIIAILVVNIIIS